MKIIYLNQYFNAPGVDSNVFIGTRAYEFAKRLVAMGHEVKMVTTLTKPKPDTPKSWFQTKEDGIEVHWLPVHYGNHMGFFGRVKAFLRFAYSSSRKAASLDGDVIYATSGPLTIALPALYTQWRKKIPLIFEVRDLWPEGAKQLGFLKNPFLYWISKQLELRTYKNAAHIVALSPGMKDGVVNSNVSSDKVSVIPNSCDLSLFHPQNDGTQMRETLGLKDKFALGYYGTMGPANGLGFVLDAAAELKRRGIKDIALVLHGLGRERPMLEERAKAEQLDNVVFSKPFVDKNKVAELVAALDVCLTIYKNVPVLYTCSPNKMFDAFAAGKPVLVNMPGWLTSILETNNCGVSVRPDDPSDFADKAVFLRDNPDLRAEMGVNGRHLAETVFSRDILAVKMEKILEQVAGKPKEYAV